MIASRYRPSTVYNQSGVSYDASEAHTNMTTFSRPVSSTKPRRSWATRSRFLPRVSTRALTLTHPGTLALGVLGRVSGLSMLYGLNRTSAKNVRVSSGKLKTGQNYRISRHTQQMTPFPSGCSLLMHTPDDRCRMIKASPVHQFRGLG